MWISSLRLLASLLLSGIAVLALDVRVLPEFFRPDPFGNIVEPDRSGNNVWVDAVRLRSARMGYASTQLIISAASEGKFELNIELAGLPVHLYREWYHLNTADRKYYPDALIPIRLPHTAQLPDPDNKVAGQKAQAFWIDIWIPADASPGVHRGKATVASGSETKSVPVEVTVLPQRIPEADIVTMDSNSYGTSWMFEQFPKTLPQKGEDALFRLIHAYHRIFYEHRSTFHQLGYGHAGKVGPEFAPELTGTGASKKVASWDRFDRHYGPLFDGSAFRDTHRGARPIPFVYLPVNPEWPASYLWWGEPGYEREFTDVVSEMEQHFREKNWTSTRFEIFFNHKKRYKGFEWDGDEIRFEKDNDYLAKYRQMLNKAVPASTPVKFVFRLDTSWSMQDQFDRLKNVINFWVAGEDILGWYPERVRELKSRGDVVWTYGGTPAVQQPSISITANPLKSWISGVDGFVRWLTVSPGPDPWFALTGGTETLVYPGDRFGIAEPMPSIRLKLQRNCVQDLALLEEIAKQKGREQVQQEVTRRFNGTALKQWRNAPPPLTGKPVLEWNNVDIDEALAAFQKSQPPPEPGAWLRVREYALTDRNTTGKAR